MEGLILVLVINFYIAWRYAPQNIGPDEGHYAAWGMLDAKPFVDYMDIKPPGIHLWMKFLAIITGKNLAAMKFLHHATIGLIMALVYQFTGSMGAALMGTAIAQSAWLFAYQSWSDALGGALLLLGFVAPPWVAVCAFGLALLMNYKLGPSALIYMVLTGMWFQIGAAAVLALLVLGGLYLFARPTIKAVYYGSVTAAGRVQKARTWQGLEFVRWTGQHGVALLLVIPAMVVLFYYGTLPVIVPIIVYLLLNGWGKVFRPCHWLPLSAIAAVLPPSEVGALFLLVDLASTRFLTVPDIWAVTYGGIASELTAARELGRIVQKELGTDKKLWVNTFHTELYIYTGMKPHYGFESLEIYGTCPEYEETFRRKMRVERPDIVIDGPMAKKWNPEGYALQLHVGPFRVWM